MGHPATSKRARRYEEFKSKPPPCLCKQRRDKGGAPALRCRTVMIAGKGKGLWLWVYRLAYRLSWESFLTLIPLTCGEQQKLRRRFARRWDARLPTSGRNWAWTWGLRGPTRMRGMWNSRTLPLLAKAARPFDSAQGGLWGTRTTAVKRNSEFKIQNSKVKSQNPHPVSAKNAETRVGHPPLQIKIPTLSQRTRQGWGNRSLVFTSRFQFLVP